jgi:general secretion pathway protein C
MMKRLLDRHEWAVDIAAAVLCASALAQAYVVALGRPWSPAPAAMVIARAKAPPPNWDRWGIRKVGAYAFEIQRSAWDGAFADMPHLTRSARIVPEVQTGHAIGFRLFSVGANGVLAALGFRTGDVICTINGWDLSTPQKALEVYAKLKSDDHFVVDFERDGLATANEYWVR